MSGWIKLHRRLLSWEWYRNQNTKDLFIHILLRANHEEGLWQGQVVKRGSYITSLNGLSSETGIPMKSVRTSLRNLQRSHNVAYEGHTSFSVITVIDYDEWQGEGTPTDKADGTPTGTQRARERATIKEDKKIRSKNNTFPFSQSIVDLGIDSNLVTEWLEVRKKKRLTNSETAFKEFKKQILLATMAGVHPNDCMTMVVKKSWGGFEYDWYVREKTKAGSMFGDQPQAEAFTPKTQTYTR